MTKIQSASSKGRAPHPMGVISRGQIQDLRSTIGEVLRTLPAPSSAEFRDEVARIAVRIANERNLFDPAQLSTLVRAELGERAVQPTRTVKAS